MVDNDQQGGWKFIDTDGTFELDDPDKTSHLYFPLVNDALMMSAISPRLHGDIKIDHHHYLTPPVSIFDLHNSRASRNFFIKINGKLWSVAGNTDGQDHEHDQTKLEAGILWHRLIRQNGSLGLKAVVTNFVPQIDAQVELMKVSLTNISSEPISFTPVAAIPMFGRSADSLRDHRHVTSLLNRVAVDKFGVVLTPVMSFDERGHNINTIQYAVLGNDDRGRPPKYIYPSVDGFIGEGGSLDRPLIDFDSPVEGQRPVFLEGFEALGGMRFEDVSLAPGESSEFYLLMSIGESISPELMIEEFASPENFDQLFTQNEDFWTEKLDQVRVYTGDARRDNWTRWVSLQPILRRLMGNSFLPYHDYGRGGRGWRDLWQDALGLLLLESDEIAEMMYAYFAGVRLDGSNATIIGNRPGEFKADRNEIPRVWMDHGVWPLKTLDMYINMTGNYAFLLREQTYFKDHLTHRTKERDIEWSEEDSNVQLTRSGKPYLGLIYEHLLVQHLTTFFNAGEHNNLLLEGGDWNDGLDMAHHKGESVAFSAFYAGNLRILAAYADKLISSGDDEIQIASELALLLDRCFDRVEYDSVDAKQTRLSTYFGAVAHSVSDEKITVKLEQVKTDLLEKSAWLTEQIRKNEWISTEDGSSWFNGYYDDNGIRVEGGSPGEVRMTLTGQVFPIMADVATDDQVEAIIKAVDRYLLDESVGGYRLNTDFKQIQLTLGRAFGFAFGHKENGAMFSHMAMMYAYSLYHRGYAAAGNRVMDSIYQHCQNFPVSRMYPGIPEYIGQDGRGYYFYLTGSASWYMFTLITQVFGVRGVEGDLLLDPQLEPEQFDRDGVASIRSHFAGRQIIFEYHNAAALPGDQYRVINIKLGENPVEFATLGRGAKIARQVIEEFSHGEIHKIQIILGA